MIGSRMAGSSFSGLLTRIEIGHIRIRGAGKARIRSFGSGSSPNQRLYRSHAKITGMRLPDRRLPNRLPLLQHEMLADVASASKADLTGRYRLRPLRANSCHEHLQNEGARLDFTE